MGGKPKKNGRVWPVPKNAMMQTYTGKHFNMLDPVVGDICIEDIAHHLSNICRYNGATRRFYSVAEHSVIVSRNVPPEFAFEALMHDASEAYLGDIVRGLKYDEAMTRYREAEAVMQNAVHERFLITSTADSLRAIDEADTMIVLDEAAQLLTVPEMITSSPRFKMLQPLGVVIAGLYPEEACAMFIRRYKELVVRDLSFPNHDSDVFAARLDASI